MESNLFKMKGYYKDVVYLVKSNPTDYLLLVNILSSLVLHLYIVMQVYKRHLWI